MVIKCPKCGERIEVDEAKLSTGEVKVKCLHCNAMFAIKRGIKKTEAPKQPAAPPLARGEAEGLGGEYQEASIAAADMAVSEQRATKRKINLKKVLVAMDGDAAVKIINDVLTENGFDILNAPDGRTVLTLIEAERPAVVILDVGLPHIFGFEISEIIKNSEKLRDTIVILVASIYDKTRYKREPQSLFGADDYIEKHHIRDSLIEKINGLLESKFPKLISARHPKQMTYEAAAAPLSEDVEDIGIKTEAVLKVDEKAADISHLEKYPEKAMLKENDLNDDVTAFKNDEIAPHPASSIRFAEQVVAKTEAASKVEKKGDALSPEHEKAKRFARIIISDIALYNQKAVENGIKKNNFYEALRPEIDEGRKLYAERVSPDIMATTNYFEEIINEFINTKRRSLGF